MTKTKKPRGSAAFRFAIYAYIALVTFPERKQRVQA